jgi:putative membrane protein
MGGGRALAHVVLAAASAWALGACNRNASTDPGNQTTQASTGTANSRGSTGQSSPVPAVGTGGASDRTGAHAPTGTEGLVGSSGGVGSTSGGAANAGASTESTTPALGTVSGGPSSPPTGSSASPSAGGGGSGGSATGSQLGGAGKSPTQGTANANSSASPGTAGTLGITANGLPGTQDDRRGAVGPAGNTSATLAAATPGSAQLASGDKNFVVTAAASGLFEVQSAQLAASRASASEVQAYAAMLVNHHQQANTELPSWPGRGSIALPAQLPQDLQAELRRVSRESGLKFDKEYLQQIGIKAHQKDIAAFESARGSIRDPQLKAWVEKTLPLLQEHLAQAQKLAQRTGG